MANNIESVKKIEEEIVKIISKMRELDKEVVKLSSSARDFTSEVKKATFPSELEDKIKSVSNSQSLVLEKTKQRATEERKLISVLAKKALLEDEATRKTLDATEKTRLETNLLRREQRNQLKSVSELSTAYEKLSAETNLLNREYKNLSVLQKQGATLTNVQKKRFDELGKTISNNRKVLVDTDAEVGQFSRNVGNYSSAYDGLAVSIAQIGREAPAAAVSLNTFILGISNNIPMLQDEITKLIKANKELTAAGKPTVNIFSRLAKALVSPQVLLAAVVTLFTLYNKQIIEFISKTFKGANQLRKFSEQQKIVNTAFKEGAKNAAAEVAQLQLLLKFSADTTKSTKERNKAVDKLIESSGGLIKEQDRLNILNGEAVRIENKLVKAILNRAIVQQLQSKISEDVNKLLDVQLKVRANQLKINELDAEAERERIEYLETTNFLEKERLKISKDTTLTQEEKIKKWNELEKAIRQNNINQKQYNSLSSVVAQLEGDNSLLLKEKSTIQTDINKLINEALRLTNSYTLNLDDNTNSSDKNTKSTEKRTEALLLQERILKNINDISKDSEVSFSLSGDFKAPKLNTDELNQSLEEINEKVAQDLLAAFDKQLLDEALNDMTNSIESFTGINADVLGNFIDTLDDVFKNGFENIGDIAKSTFETVGEVANSFFNGNIEGINQQIEANQAYYDNVLSNENLSDEARKKAEKDREGREKKLLERKRKEQAKQAQINKALNVFNIINNTAQGVTAALATANIPLSVLIGSLGAAQLALALSTPIPKFAEGGVMDHDGLMMINDHPSGRLEVVERDGKFMMTTKKDAIVQGKKGDIIHKDASKVFENKTDEQIINNLDTYVMTANLSSNMAAIYKAENKKNINHYKLQTDRVVRAINKKKSNFVVNNSNNIDLNYLRYSNF